MSDTDKNMIASSVTSFYHAYIQARCAFLYCSNIKTMMLAALRTCTQITLEQCICGGNNRSFRNHCQEFVAVLILHGL